MSVEEIVRDTGIYRVVKRKTHPTPASDREAFIRRFQELTTRDFDGLLNSIEGWSNAILKQHGFGPGPISTVDVPDDAKPEVLRIAAELQRRLKLQNAVSRRRFDDAPAIAGDANEVLQELQILRAAMARGDVGESVFVAVKLGRIVERMHVRPVEPLAMTGRKVTEGGRDGAERVHGSAKDTDERYRRYVASVDALAREHPEWTKGAVVAEVARKSSTSDRTIRKALQRNNRTRRQTCQT